MWLPLVGLVIAGTEDNLGQINTLIFSEDQRIGVRVIFSAGIFDNEMFQV